MTKKKKMKSLYSFGSRLRVISKIEYDDIIRHENIYFDSMRIGEEKKKIKYCTNIGKNSVGNIKSL